MKAFVDASYVPGLFVLGILLAAGDDELARDGRRAALCRAQRRAHFAKERPVERLRWVKVVGTLGQPLVVVTRTAMAAQLEHLVEASYRPNLGLGVIPWTIPVHSPALHCFTIFDDRAVIFGTETATAIITDPDDIADYDKRHTLYSQLTVVGDPARAVLARLAAEYRDLA